VDGIVGIESILYVTPATLVLQFTLYAKLHLATIQGHGPWLLSPLMPSGATKARSITFILRVWMLFLTDFTQSTQFILQRMVAVTLYLLHATIFYLTLSLSGYQLQLP
jgi:hypothetical protein